MTEDMVAAALWLKSRPDCTGKIGATGFCYGGRISNILAVRLGADLAAAAPFYGGPPATEDIPKIKAAILVHHGELDTRLAATWPAYDQALNAANVPHEGYIYPGAVTASIAMRRRNATTKPRPTWPGSARSTGSTNTCVADSATARPGRKSLAARRGCNRHYAQWLRELRAISTRRVGGQREAGGPGRGLQKIPAVDFPVNDFSTPHNAATAWRENEKASSSSRKALSVSADLAAVASLEPEMLGSDKWADARAGNGRS